MQYLFKKTGTIALTVVVALTLVILFAMLIIITIDNSYAFDVWQENITKTGIFNYTQTNESGKPAWVNTGNWSLIESTPLVFTFDAVINMIKPDGTDEHRHKVNDLTISYAPVNQNNSTIIYGTTTITMNEDIITDLQTTITLSENNISVYFDPTKIDNHFGNQLVTGLITK